MLWYVNWTREAGKILKKFETDIIDKTKNDGYNGNEDLAEVQWNFAGALLYSVTVITTIGKKKNDTFFRKKAKNSPFDQREESVRTVHILELLGHKNCTDFYVLF